MLDTFGTSLYGESLFALLRHGRGHHDQPIGVLPSFSAEIWDLNVVLLKSSYQLPAVCQSFFPLILLYRIKHKRPLDGRELADLNKKDAASRRHPFYLRGTTYF